MNTKTIQSNFQFLANRIVTLNVKNDFAVLDTNDDKGKYRFDADYEVKQVFQNADNNGVFGGVLQVVVKAEAKKGKKHLLINLTTEGYFESNTDNEDEFKKMLEINGSTALYSISRAIIVNVSSLSCIGGQLTLPMINIFNLHQMKNRTQQEKQKGNDATSK